MNKKLLFSLITLLAFNNLLNAQAFCPGPFPTTVEANLTAPNWTTGNAGVSDNTYDAITLNSAGNSGRLGLTGFGFSLPSNAIVSGITVAVERSVSGGTIIEDFEILLIKAGTVQTAENKAMIGTAWPLTDATATYGGSTDKWSNTWTYTDINSANFGVAIAATRTTSTGAPRTAQIDMVTITVCYDVLLPLKLRSFQTVSIPAAKLVKAEWITFNEDNVKRIELEKSIDQLSFATIGKITPKGNGLPTDNHYNYTDNSPVNGINFYRLKFIDADGIYTYSEIKTASVTSKEKLGLSYNNGMINITIDDKPGNYYVQVISVTGQVILNRKFNTSSEKTFLQIPVEAEKGKIVLVKLGNNQSFINKKILIN